MAFIQDLNYKSLLVYIVANQLGKMSLWLQCTH